MISSAGNPSTSTHMNAGATMNKQPLHRQNKGDDSDDDDDYDNASTTTPSMTFSLFVSWVIPVLILAFISRYTADTTIPTIHVPDNASSSSSSKGSKKQKSTTATSATTTPKSRHPSSSYLRIPPAVQEKLSHLPSSYRQVIETIHRRRRGRIDIVSQYYSNEKEHSTKEKKASTGSSSVEAKTAGKTATTAATLSEAKTPADTSSSTPAASTNQSQRRQQRSNSQSDPAKQKLLDKIEEQKQLYQQSPDDLLIAIRYADLLRLFELQYHLGGRYEREAIDMYRVVVEMAQKQRQEAIDRGLSTGPASGANSINDEVTMDYSFKSIDGILCSLYASQGKVYYMANMFERAVESYTRCIEDVAASYSTAAEDADGAAAATTYYLDAHNSRGSAYIILGKYREAATDFLTVIDRDAKLFFTDAYTGLARVLAADEDAATAGTGPEEESTWSKIAYKLEAIIDRLESQMEDYIAGGGSNSMITNALNRFYHVMFTYHDVKTKDAELAWEALQNSYKYKMMALPAWNHGFEKHKVSQTRDVFRKGFWSEETGSTTQVPIFIVGFVRSGSTLLERVLDAHPQIVGTGENSVFNGRLEEIRNKIVEISMSGQGHMLGPATRQFAEEVVDEMRRRWHMIERNAKGSNNSTDIEEGGVDEEEPERFVDKMLTNYYNVGFIQMLYPKALIFHVFREPMDTLFSAYKHEFPPGTLDYTSDFKPLAELYHAYRDVIEHWDEVLPGRVTHVRYEDMVNDMPGMAKAIIEATGLEWDDSVLDFHTKKHAVNTLSTTQVRKGIYKDSVKSWKRYEEQLRPLAKLIGGRVKYDLKTSLPGYRPPPPPPPAVESKDETESIPSGMDTVKEEL